MSCVFPQPPIPVIMRILDPRLSSPVFRPMTRSMNSHGPFLITNVEVNGGIDEGDGRSPPKYP
jgi:hypothetical protein